MGVIATGRSPALLPGEGWSVVQRLYVITDAAGQMFRESSGQPQENECFGLLE